MTDLRARLKPLAVLAARHRLKLGAAASAGLLMGLGAASLAPERAVASPTSEGRVIRIVVEARPEPVVQPIAYSRLATLAAAPEGLPEDPSLASARADAEVRGYLAREEAEQRDAERAVRRALAEADATMREAPTWPAPSDPAPAAAPTPG